MGLLGNALKILGTGAFDVGGSTGFGGSTPIAPDAPWASNPFNDQSWGVNARDLETLLVEPTVVHRLLPLIPSDRLAIAESGISTRADVSSVAARGASAVLVGTALSLASDPGVLLAQLSSVRRGPVHA